MFEDVPKKAVETNHLAAVDGIDEALKSEMEKVESFKKIISLQNGNAKAVQLWNIHQAIDWFKRKEGDTGSPEVQGKIYLYIVIYQRGGCVLNARILSIFLAAILTVRIHNINSHLNQHRKDKHNYKQLRNMVHQRAKILKYLKSKDSARYYACLNELGVEPRAVEGEITL